MIFILKAKKSILWSGLAYLLVFSIGWSQSVDTAVQGIVLNEEGEAVAAVTIYLRSPSLPGIHLALTEKSGLFYLPGLPAGNYTLLAERPGYKSILIDSINLQAGQMVFLKIRLPKSEKEGEVVVSKRSAGGDISSPQFKTFMESLFFTYLPVGRNLNFLLKASPQVALSEFDKDEIILLGSSWRNSTYYFEGINVTDNLTLRPATDFDLSIIESLEITTSAQSLGQIPAGSTHINILSKSGSNNFSGAFGLSVIKDSWNRNLWTTAELSQKGLAAVSGVKDNFQPFFNLGGRFWADRAWFFLSSQYNWLSMDNIIPSPFIDIHGQRHESYDLSRSLATGFFKITVRPIAEALASAWLNFSRAHEPANGDFLNWVPFISTRLLDRDEFLSLNGAGSYFLDRWTILGGRVAYSNRISLAFLQEEARDNFWSDDRGDRFGPLTGADYNCETKVEQISGEAEARRFLANWPGLRHILKAGLSFNQTTSYIDWWRANNLVWFLDSRRANNYFYSKEGLVGFWLCGSVKTSTLVRGQTQRLGGYIGDTVTFGHRLTLDLSLRLDRVSAGFSGASKATSGNPLAYFVGEAVVKPLTKKSYPDIFPDGLNPWGVLSFSDRGDFISWLTLSPRLGLVINLWGEGKTLIKGCWAIYHDELTPRALLPLHPLYPTFVPFFWLDANGDGRPNSEDEFIPQSFDFRSLSNNYLDKRVAKDLTSPQFKEFSWGVEHHFNPNFCLSLKFVSRQEKNIMADVLYDPKAGESWYLAEGLAVSKYWLPFTTTVPGNDDFPNQTVTFFVRSNQAPYFRQWQNVAELERKYRAFEFSLDKKMSAGWGLLATLILSRTEGNAPKEIESINSIRQIIEANYFINRYGRLETDRPVLLKVQGAFDLPLGFTLGAIYQYQSGRPWSRRVWILPPADWCFQKGGERVYYEVLLEPTGHRREKPFSFFDLRLEKILKLGDKRLTLTLDILNLLGQRREIVGLNDVDIWEPSSEGANKSGKMLLSPDYQLTRELLGKRVFRLTLKLLF
ncbi:MAG: carboxypeptidase-like regulatory domain-containing protein [Candidatus Aminicenantes bacterium]|nr:carboxypeptidase-like regulatory domain-containing protein [Candidatus Aminicenantes bacterium]